MASLYKQALKNAEKMQNDSLKAYEKAKNNAKISKNKTETQTIPKNQNKQTTDIPTRAKDRHNASRGRRNSATAKTESNKRQTPRVLPRADERETGTGKFIGQAAFTGLAGANKALAETADFLLPDFLTPRFVQKGIDYYKKAGEEEEKKLQSIQTSKGKEIVGTLISGTVQALPNAALAFMSGGASLGAEGAAIGAETATGVKALTGTAAKTMKNPAFWSSFMQTAGPTYEKEKAQGASEGKATASALTNALIGSAIEISGGIERFDPNQGALKALLKTAAEEGSEEIKQYAAENLINKALGSDTSKWFSIDPAEDAVINPTAAAIQGAYGAGIGAIMGGGQRALFRGLNGKPKGIPRADEPSVTSENKASSIADGKNITNEIMTPETQQKIFSAVENRSGTKIVRADLPDGIDGTYENGVITISNSAKNPAYTVLKHELTHHIETSGNYRALSDFIENSMRDSGYDVDGALNQITADYKLAGKELSPEQAKKEFVAKFSEEYLFNSEKSIERLARENPSIFRQVYDWIVDTIKKIGASDETKFLIDAQRKYEKALRTVDRSSSGETQYLFAGRQSVTADETSRQTAEEMLKSGKTPQEVWQQTGWRLGIDGKWKYEIDDSLMNYDGNGRYHSNPDIRRYRELEDKVYFKNSGTEADMAELQSLSQNLSGVSMEPRKLGDMIEHTELFKAYPQLKNVDVQFANLPDNIGASYNPELNRIVINRNSKVNPGKVKMDIIHEIQHAIQKKEGFASGSSPDTWDKKLKDDLSYLSKQLETSERIFNGSIDGLIDYLEKSGFKKINDINFNIMSESGKQEIYSYLEENAPHLIGHAKEILETRYAKNSNLRRQISELKNRSIFDLYQNTAGEIEARQAASRINLNNEQRRDILPFAGDDNTVFIDSSEPAFSMPLEQRVSGDALLDAQDNLDIVKSVGGNVDDNGYVTLYHRTSKENADKIKKSGKMSAKEDGIFFSTQKSGYNDGYGDSIVELKIPAEKLVLDDIFDNEAHFRIPLKNKDTALDVSDYLVNDAYSSGKNLESTDYTRRLKQTSQNLYGETGNKYLDIPKADETMPKQSAAEPKAEPEPVKAPRGSVKARGYERRQINQLKQNIKSSLGVNKYSDNAKMNALIDEAVEKMKNGRLSDSEKNALFDTLFEEGIITDTAMFDRYSDLKRDLRSTAIKVTDDIKANIPDFQNFRKETFGKLRLNDAEGMAADDLYTGLRMRYPELFPELNTTSEMVQRLAEVAGSIKQAETRLTHAFSTDIETLRAETKAGFDAAMDEMEKQVNIVSKYLSMPTVISSDEATAYARNIKQIQRDIENLSSKILLDDEDWGTVDMLLKGRISPKTVRQININAENIITMYEAKAKLQAAEKGLADIKAKTRAEYTRQAEDSINGSELWQDRAGFRMSRETPERVMYDIAGKESGQKLIDNFIQPIHQNEAISTKMKNELRGTVKELNISTEPQYEVYAHAIEAPGLKEEHLNEIRKTGGKIKLSESALVQLYGEGLIDTDVLTIVGADVPKIQNAVTTMRQIYNQLIDAANQELIRHGYEPIEYRKDYFPHFTEERPDGVLANIADKLGIKILKDELPTDIAGLTHTFRPGKKWFGNALSRTGRYTEYDAIKGFDIYLEGIADVIHHTEDIQKLRTLENTLRLRYSDEGVRSEILKLDEQMTRGEISEAVRDARAALIFDAGDTKLGSFATWLRNYTDSLAGKKTLLDRTFEHAIGRTLYNSSKAIENRVAANMVALNPASWLTNFIPIVQAGEVKQINLIKGMAQTINNKVRPDSFADASVFLTNRKGSDVLWKSSTEKWQDVLTSPMKWIDEFTSETITRAKYLEEIDKGASPAEAMRAADDLAASIIADRSKGALPNVFNSKNPISKILTMYQVEVNNQWSHLLKDIPRTEGNVMRVAMAFAKYAIASYLFDDIYEYFIGRRPALDPISWLNDFVGDVTGKKVPNFMEAIFEDAGFDVEKKTGGAAVAALGKNIAQDIPFVGGLLEGGRVPISSALPSASKLAATGGNLITGDVPTNKALYDIGNELTKPLAYMALPYGGGQIKKIAEGTETFVRKGNYAVNNDGEDELRYAVDPTAGNLLKGLLFGRYSMGNADEYIDSGFKRLSKNKTQAYKDAVEAGASPQEVEKFLRSLNTQKKSEMRTAIMNSDFTVSQKNALGLPLEKDKTVDYSSPTSYQTSLLTPKQQEKVSNLKIAGLSDEDALEAYNLYLNTDGSDMAKSIEMLTKRSYQNIVLEALGISKKTANKARKLTSAGITGKQYDTVKKLADANGSGNVSIEEAKAYLDSKSFTRKEKFALVKALTNCKDKNNPYR